jgi:hypothetical protein
MVSTSGSSGNQYPLSYLDGVNLRTLHKNYYTSLTQRVPHDVHFSVMNPAGRRGCQCLNTGTPGFGRSMPAAQAMPSRICDGRLSFSTEACWGVETLAKMLCETFEPEKSEPLLLGSGGYFDREDSCNNKFAGFQLYQRSFWRV